MVTGAKRDCSNKLGKLLDIDPTALQCEADLLAGKQSAFRCSRVESSTILRVGQEGLHLVSRDNVYVPRTCGCHRAPTRGFLDGRDGVHSSCGMDSLVKNPVSPFLSPRLREDEQEGTTQQDELEDEDEEELEGTGHENGTVLARRTEFEKVEEAREGQDQSSNQRGPSEETNASPPARAVPFQEFGVPQ